MKIAITGGAGFIGYHLHKRLEELGNQVISIDNFSHPSKAPHKAIYGDIRYYDSVVSLIKNSDIVFHLAAQIHVDKSRNNPEETIDTNINGTLNVLEACRRYGKKLVFASSSEVYGTSTSIEMGEHHPTNPQSPYAASKLAGDALCRAYIDTYKMDIVVLRNFNTFGIYQNDGSYGGVISIFTKAALEGKPLHIFGNGEQERDYMEVSDAVQAYIISAFSQDKLVGVLNAGTGKTITVNEIADLVKKITKSKSEIIHVEPRPGEVQRLCADNSLAMSYGFKPTTVFERDLESYINWYSKENGFS